jgi:hypothetical protein
MKISIVKETETTYTLGYLNPESKVVVDMPEETVALIKAIEKLWNEGQRVMEEYEGSV